MPPGRFKGKGKRPPRGPPAAKRKGKPAPAAAAPSEEEYEPLAEDQAWFAAHSGGFLESLQPEALQPVTKLKADRKKEVSGRSLRCLFLR